MNKIKNYLYSIAMQSPLRKWALSLTGWKYWVWQLGVGGIVFAVLEYLLNIIGMTMLPWRYNDKIKRSNKRKKSFIGI